MFALCSDITIGKFKNVKPHEVKVTTSIFEYVNKAVLKLPLTARIKQAGKVLTATTETAKNIQEGDAVTILLGYNGNLKTEFTGFVARLNYTSPLEIECEGYSYQLRKKQMSGTLVKTTLLAVMKKLIEGTDIVLDEKKIPNFPIDKLILEKKSGTDVLEMIKKTSGNLIRFTFNGNVLWGGLTYLQNRGEVKYRLGYNVIKDGNLKKREAKNDNVIVTWKGEMKDGTKVTATSGSKGQVKVKTSHAITDKSALKQLADADVQKQSYDGYEGKITAFGSPFCEAGYKCILEDKKYPDRGGNYVVQSVEVVYGMSGFRRTVGIGAKL